ncbi:MAG: hypothetical protein AB1487_08735 [Thermodesulfobacteriota bacterium]
MRGWIIPPPKSPRHFDAVEVDSTYYSPSAARNAMLWAERIKVVSEPANIVFVIL